MTNLKIIFRTALALRITNLVRVFWYRLGVKIEINQACRLHESAPSAPFFHAITVAPLDLPVTSNWQPVARLFSYWPYVVGTTAPEWQSNLLTGKMVPSPDRDWWKIPDFDPALGDIKPVWEASRFDWLLAFAQRARSGNSGALKLLNAWLDDWSKHNVPYKGVNWKCGQEASIRVMHLAMTALLLSQHKETTAGLLQMIRVHLLRIAPTVSYAIAQDNNHGTSEATALFIGGSWLAANGIIEGRRWQQLGCKLLENRALHLIGEDGTFSQYSLNYHRVMLDTFCMAEIWRRRMKLPRFSSAWYSRVAVAADWLRSLISPCTGEGPNLGANDGARLLQLVDVDYRDYRPAVQLAMVLFVNVRAYHQDGSWNVPLRWLEIDIPSAAAKELTSRQFDAGGFAVLRRKSIMAMLRYPRFRFRPSHADALHLDLWNNGINLLRDAGTYSYNTDARWLSYFAGTESHNTVQFDDRDQMPRLGRFLFGDWLKTNNVEPLSEFDDGISFGAAYKDRHGASHKRRVSLTETFLKVEDHIDGFKRKAVLRWRLAPGNWTLLGNRITNGTDMLCIESTMPIHCLELINGWESRYYLEKEKSPVLRVEVECFGTLTTYYRWGV